MEQPSNSSVPDGSPHHLEVQLARLPREILRVVVDYMYRFHQLRSLASLAATCRSLQAAEDLFWEWDGRDVEKWERGRSEAVGDVGVREV